MSTTREQIIRTTCELLEAQGYRATGLNQIVQESGSPKGSLYYYFPDGKDGLTEEAIERASRAVAERIRSSLARFQDPGEAIRQLILTIAGHAEASGYRTGGPITTVALETATSNERLNRACRAAYQEWQSAFEEKLAASGYSHVRAAQLATLITAAIEGAIILSRTYHSTEPFERVADELGRLISSEQSDGCPP